MAGAGGAGAQRHRPSISDWAAPCTMPLAWVAIALVLLVGYSNRYPALGLGERLIGDIMPQRGTVVGDAVNFRAVANGHFLVEAEVNGIALRLLFNTGISDVTLSPADARCLGFDVVVLRLFPALPHRQGHRFRRAGASRLGVGWAGRARQCARLDQRRRDGVLPPWCEFPWSARGLFSER